MPKPEREFFPVADVEWERNKEGSSQQVLAFEYVCLLAASLPHCRVRADETARTQETSPRL